MTMQDVVHQLFADSVWEEFSLLNKNVDEQSITDILMRLDLLDYKEKHPMTLSGGQKQRLALAVATLANKDIVIFDEPTSGLDLQHMQEVANELTAIQDMGKTSLVITHDYELIVSCCTYILHLENGKIQEQYVLDEKGIQRLKTFFMKTR